MPSMFSKKKLDKTENISSSEISNFTNSRQAKTSNSQSGQ